MSDLRSTPVPLHGEPVTRPNGVAPPESQPGPSSMSQPRRRTQQSSAKASTGPDPLQRGDEPWQKTARKAQSFFRFLVPFLVTIGRLAYKFVILLLPLALWGASKYLTWTVGSFLGKIERTLSWVSWLIGYLPKSEGASIT
ncbi:hypothetical protein ACKKBG_A33795 [Auxenochlorella protothecoides x Auxenochlorella symbiontica]